MNYEVDGIYNLLTGEMHQIQPISCIQSRHVSLDMQSEEYCPKLSEGRNKIKTQITYVPSIFLA